MIIYHQFKFFSKKTFPSLFKFFSKNSRILLLIFYTFMTTCLSSICTQFFIAYNFFYQYITQPNTQESGNKDFWLLS